MTLIMEGEHIGFHPPPSAHLILSLRYWWKSFIASSPPVSPPSMLILNDRQSFNDCFPPLRQEQTLLASLSMLICL